MALQPQTSPPRRKAAPAGCPLWPQAGCEGAAIAGGGWQWDIWPRAPFPGAPVHIPGSPQRCDTHKLRQRRQQSVPKCPGSWSPAARPQKLYPGGREPWSQGESHSLGSRAAGSVPAPHPAPCSEPLPHDGAGGKKAAPRPRAASAGLAVPRDSTALSLSTPNSKCRF